MNDPFATDTETLDLLGDLANEVPEERGEFEDLPVNAWVIGKICGPDNGKAAPEVREQVSKKEETKGQSFYQINTGILAVGGDASLDAKKHNNRIIYYSCFIEKGQKETHAGPISGQFTGFLNACFAPGVGADFVAPAGADKETKERLNAQRNAARWAATVAALKAAAESNPECTLKAYDGNRARLIAGLAVAALTERPRLLLFKTKRRTYTTKAGDTRTSTEASSIEDYSPENAAKRRVSMFDAGAEGFGY